MRRLRLSSKRVLLALLVVLGRSRWIAICYNLRDTLWMRRKQREDDSTLQECIELVTEILLLCRRTEIERSLYACLNLGDSLEERFKQARDGTLLDEAIQLTRLFLALMPADHPRRAGIYITQFHSLKERYEQKGESTFLDESIELDRMCLLRGLLNGKNDLMHTLISLIRFWNAMSRPSGSGSSINPLRLTERRLLCDR